LLGLKREADSLRIRPCIPADWETFLMTYRFGETTYRIEVTQHLQAAGPSEIAIRLDGIDQPGVTIPLKDDHRIHLVELIMGKPSVASETLDIQQKAT